MNLGALRSRSRRTVGLAAAVLTVGLAGGAGATTGLALAADDARSAELALRAAGVRGALGAALQRYADTMHDLVAVASTPAVAATSAAAITPATAGNPPTAATANSSATAGNPATPGNPPNAAAPAAGALAPPAPGASLGGAGSLADAVARIAGERLAGAHQVLVVDSGRRVLAQHAADGSTPPAAGRLAAEPELARALELAAAHGRLVASPAHVLPADAGLPPEQRKPGFELVAPVPAGALRGWVIVSVRADDLLHSALGAATVAGVSAQLTETGPDGVAREVANWSPAGPALGDRVQRLELPIAGHTWHVLVRPTTALAGPWRTAAAPVTALLAVLGSFALAALVLAAGGERGRHEEAARQTADATERARAATERARAATERARAAEELHRQREDELAGFAVTASEHLHAPLHTIAGFTELLMEDAAPGLDEESRGFLRRIDDATRRMLTIVNELLTYAMSGDSALKPEPVEASLLALDVAAAHLPGPSIEIGELPAIAGDAALLRQVLDQMITNAARFVRHGTPARISVGAHQTDDGWWRIEVADRGIGVPEQQRARIFAPFHRAPAAEGYPGTGLGLAVCARIIALHGGEIGVRPNPGGGSVFWFTVASAETGTRKLALSS